MNPDGFTRWWNPSEFPQDGTIFGYKDGLLGTTDSIADFNCTLNGYKYFCDDLDDSDAPLTDVTLAGRGMFSAGQKNVRHYTIELGEDGLIFNYAVDAAWQFPSGDPPYTAPDDFLMTANRDEPWRIDIEETGNTLWNDGDSSGGELHLSVDVYDWLDAGLNTVRVESTGNFAITQSSVPTGGGDGYSTYEIDITSATPSEGEISLLISVDTGIEGYQGMLPGETIASYFMHSVSVSGETPASVHFELGDGALLSDYYYDDISPAWRGKQITACGACGFPTSWIPCIHIRYRAGCVPMTAEIPGPMNRLTAAMAARVCGTT